MNTRPTREQRIESLKSELAALKAELKKAKTPFQRAVIMDEIRAVSRQLARLTN